MKMLRQLFYGFFVDFPGNFPSPRPHLQLAAVKENAGSVVGEVSEATGIGLDQLDGAVEAFGAGVGDAVAAVVEQALLMAPEHSHDLLDGLQSASHGALGPSIEVALGGRHVAVCPELREGFFEHPSPAGFQIELLEGTKGNGLAAAAIGIGL